MTFLAKVVFVSALTVYSAAGQAPKKQLPPKPTSSNNANNQGQQDQSQLPICDLRCTNGGSCSFVSTDVSTLTSLVQRGTMVHECNCVDSYGGLACDSQLALCQENGKCPNGVPCHENANNEPSCECSDAARVSKFALNMCLKPYTEYCGSHFDPKENQVSYCTNGGKCKSSIIAAQVAPGNTTVNDSFRHMGCICPREFYGPHCELLQKDLIQIKQGEEGAGDFPFDDGFWEENKGLSDESNKQWSAASITLVSITALLAVLVLLVTFRNYSIYRRQRRRKRDGDRERNYTTSMPHHSLRSIRQRRQGEMEQLDASTSTPHVSNVIETSLHASSGHSHRSISNRSSHHSSSSGCNYYEIPRQSSDNYNDDDDPSIIVLDDEPDGSSQAPIVVSSSNDDDNLFPLTLQRGGESQQQNEEPQRRRARESSFYFY